MLDEELRKTLEPYRGSCFYVYHAAFAYFTADYGLEQIAVEVSGRGPTPKQLVRISEQAREEGVKLIFIQPQFDRISVTAFAEAINGEVAILDPLEHDVFANLRKLAESVASTAPE